MECHDADSTKKFVQFEFVCVSVLKNIAKQWFIASIGNVKYDILADFGDNHEFPGMLKV